MVVLHGSAMGSLSNFQNGIKVERDTMDDAMFVWDEQSNAWLVGTEGNLAPLLTSVESSIENTGNNVIAIAVDGIVGQANIVTSVSLAADAETHVLELTVNGTVSDAAILPVANVAAGAGISVTGNGVGGNAYVVNAVFPRLFDVADGLQGNVGAWASIAKPHAMASQQAIASFHVSGWVPTAGTLASLALEYSTDEGSTWSTISTKQFYFSQANVHTTLSGARTWSLAATPLSVTHWRVASSDISFDSNDFLDWKIVEYAP